MLTSLSGRELGGVWMKAFAEAAKRRPQFILAGLQFYAEQGIKIDMGAVESQAAGFCLLRS